MDKLENIDELVKELEDAYWLTVHNKSTDDYVRRMTFGNYQFIHAYYFARGEKINSDYKKIHDHFYNQECHKNGT